jgi:PAS domain S-box-containing protein
MAKTSDIGEILGQVTNPAALLEGFFAHAPFGLQIYRADGHCLLTNQAFRDLFGSEPPPEYNVLNDEIAAQRGVLGMLRRAFAGEAVQTPAHWYDPRELRQVHVTEGRRVAISAAFFPLYGNGGAVEHVAVVFKDETAEVTARERVETSERLLRQLIEESGDLVFVKDQDGRYEVANPASARVAGRAVEEILGHTDDDVFPPEAARALRDIDRRIVARGVAETYDESFEVGGELRHFSTAKTPRRDAQGLPTGIIGISRDITDRKRGEQALARLAAENQALLERARADEQWLATILEQTPTALVFIEPDTARLFFANAAADRLAGGTMPRPGHAADYVRLLDMRDLADRPLAAADNPLVRASRGEPLTGLQVRWHLPGGVHVVAMHSARLRAVHGHADTVLVAFDDITTLKDVQAALEEAVRARQDFLSIAGHELKTPLTSLLLVIRSIDHGLAQARAGLGAGGVAAPLLDIDRRLGDRWRTLQRQVGRLSSLVDQLLDVSRLAASKLALEIEALDLSEVVREVTARFTAPSEGGGSAAIAVDAAAPVPGEWDRLRLEQMISNLVSNAVKYGAGRPVTVRVRADARAAEVAVRDQGIGIAPEAIERIFDRFERAASVRHYGGLGLGLWIVRQLAEAMAGSVRVESAVGQGSTFTLRLPRRPPAADCLAEPEASA